MRKVEILLLGTSLFLGFAILICYVLVTLVCPISNFLGVRWYIPYFLENKPAYFFYEMKFFGLFSNRLIFEVFSEKRKKQFEQQDFF